MIRYFSKHNLLSIRYYQLNSICIALLTMDIVLKQLYRNIKTIDVMYIKRIGGICQEIPVTL